MRLIPTRRVSQAACLLVVALVLALVAPATALPKAQRSRGAVASSAGAVERFSTVDTTAAAPSAADFRALRAAADQDGWVRVIVGLRTTFTPEGALSRAGVTAQRERIASQRAALRTSLAGTRFQTARAFDTIPYVALELSADAQEALRRSPAVASVAVDGLSRPLLADSIPLVEADETAAVGANGSGTTVAVLDTGVDKAHPFLSPRVVSEACFSGNGNCPGGGTSQLGSGAGVPCTYADGCTHGTHVAGIAAGRGSSSRGVAPRADLLAIQVFSRFTGADCAGAGEDPCALSFFSDQIAGLARVLTLHATLDIASANLSIGGGTFTAACDGVAPAYKTAIDNLRSVGVPAVIASGNDGAANAMSFPGCISSAVSVGSTTKADGVSSFSNSTAALSLLAPGQSIVSSVPGGGFANFSGTSMATPHVAGAWALLKQRDPSISVAGGLSALRVTGRLVTDARQGRVTPRIRTLSAVTTLGDSGFTQTYRERFTGGGVASQGVGLAQRLGGPGSATIRLTRVPADATVRKAWLYWSTIGGRDRRATFEGAPLTGSLVGASRDTCWGIDRGQPNRVYRAAVTRRVSGTGSYTVGGVGDIGNADGQGASLVVVYSRASGTRQGRIVVKHGALSAITPGETLSEAMALSVPSPVASASLHMGFGDGETLTEDPITFRTRPVTPPDAVSGSDGPAWDDLTRTLRSTDLPVGASSGTVRVTTRSECLLWAYSALDYRA